MAVPTYDQAYGQLGSVYDPQVGIVNSQLADLPRQQQAVQASLDQAKVNAFKDITNSSNARGVLFSGVPIDEQAQYVGTKYLPAVADNQTSFNNQKTSLLGKIADINSQRAKDAMGMVSSAQQEADKVAYQNAQLADSRANRAASRAAASSKPLTQQQAVAAIRSNLLRVKGGDGHVNPKDLAMAYQDFTGLGFTPNDFWKYYKGFWNPKQSNYGDVFHAALR